MKNFVVEYIDRTPLRVFLIDVDDTPLNDALWRIFDTTCAQRMNTHNVLIASRQVCYYRVSEEFTDDRLSNTQWTQIILSAIESGRTALNEEGKRTITSVSFTGIAEFFKHIGFSVNGPFAPDSVAGQIDAQIRPRQQ